MSMDEHQEKREGEGTNADLEKAIKLSLDPSFLPQGQPPSEDVIKHIKIRHNWTHSSEPEDDKSEKMVHESSSTMIQERTESGTKKTKMDQTLKSHEALLDQILRPCRRPGLDQDLENRHVSLAGPNPEHMDEDFYATAYPKVHENLKLKPDEHVIEENSESHSGFMSSMKNLEDTDTYGDLFLKTIPTVGCSGENYVADEGLKADTSTPPMTLTMLDLHHTNTVFAPKNSFATFQRKRIFKKRNKKKAKSKQIQARNGKDKVKSQPDEDCSKEAKKKSKAGICFRFTSHNKHTSFLLSKEAQAASPRLRL
ncbi:hypothetical protein Tco_0355598 [Tanacetum coccineum]